MGLIYTSGAAGFQDGETIAPLEKGAHVPDKSGSPTTFDRGPSSKA